MSTPIYWAAAAESFLIRRIFDPTQKNSWWLLSSCLQPLLELGSLSGVLYPISVISDLGGEVTHPSRYEPRILQRGTARAIVIGRKSVYLGIKRSQIR